MKKFIHRPRSAFGSSNAVTGSMTGGEAQVNPGSNLLHRLEGKLITEKTRTQESCNKPIYSTSGTSCNCLSPRPFHDLHHSPFWLEFVLLPNSQKVALARRSTFTLPLQMALVQCLESSLASPRLDEIVTLSNLANPDHQDWLVDECCGQNRWCVLADILFCIFENEHSEHPLKVLMLPGMQVNTLTYQSAKKDVLTSPVDGAAISTVTMVTGNRTVSGMCAHQLVITNPVLEEKYVYGADTHSAIDRWSVYLKAAANLDTDVFLESDKKSEEKSSCRSVPSTSSSASRKHSTTTHSDGPSPRYVPSPRSAKQRMDYPQDDPDNKENNMNASQKHSPVSSRDRVVFTLGDVNGDISSVNTTSSGESSQSQKPETNGTNVKIVKHNRALSMDCEQVKSPSPTLRKPRLVRSNSATAAFPRSSFGARIARKATSIRGKMFSAKVKGHCDMRLGSLCNIQISGPLHHKQLLKWIRLWCVISDGVLYGFKSEDPSEKAELTLPLEDCSLTTVETDKNKRMYIFNLCHASTKHVYLSAGNIYEFDRWFDVFQKEAVYKTARSSLTSTPRDDPNTSVQTDIHGNFTSKSASPVATSSQTRRKRNQLRLKINRSLDSTISLSSQGSVTDNESEISGCNTPISQPISMISPSKQHEQLSSSLSTFQSRNINHANGGHEHQKYTFWTETYIKNYLPSQNSQKEGSFTEPNLPDHVQNHNSSKKSLSKSSSDASLDVKLLLQNLPLPAPHTPFYREQDNGTPRENLVLPIAARDIETPTVSGYLEQFVTETEWISIWCVLKQSVLYIYGAPIDDETVDVIGLKGYRVTVLKPVGSRKFAFQLRGEDGDFHIFSTENKEDLHVWVPSIHRAIGVAHSNSQVSQPITQSTDPLKKLLEDNKTMQEKLALLEELQRQCNELKQPNQVNRKSPVSSVRVKCESPNLEKPEHKNTNEDLEKSVKDMTHLRKRRLSTELKMDILQKELFQQQQQMQKPDKGKRRFSLNLFERTKPNKSPVNQPETPPSPVQIHLQNQIKELSSEMSDIERDMGIQKIKQQLHGLTSGNTYLGTFNMESKETQSASPKEEQSPNNKFKSGILSSSSRANAANKCDQRSMESSQENSSPTNSERRVRSQTVTRFMTQPCRRRRNVQSLPNNVNEDNDTYPRGLHTLVTSGGKTQEKAKSAKNKAFITHGRSISIDTGDLELHKAYKGHGLDHSSLFNSKGKKQTFVDQNRNSVNGFPRSLDADRTEVNSKTKNISPTVLAQIAAFEELIQEQTSCLA